MDAFLQIRILCRRTWPWVGVGLVAFLVHWTALDGAFVFDDSVVASENPVAQAWPPDWEGIGSKNYWGDRPGYEKNAVFRPAVTFSFALNRHLHGDEPHGYRMWNLLLHVGVTILVGLLCWLLTRSRTIACLAALLFAVHPVHCDAVASIANRTELLCAFSYLGALILYLWGRVKAGPARMGWFLASFAMFALALCSKENAVTFPGIVLLCETWFWWRDKGGEGWRSVRWGYAIGTVLLVMAYLVWRIAVLAEPFGGATPPQDNPIIAGGLMARVLMPFKQLVVVGEVLVFPLRLTADYSFNALPLVTSWLDPTAWLGVFGVAGLVFLVVRGTRRLSYVAFGALFFGITYLLVSNFVILSTILFAERLLYLPSVGFCLAVAVWVAPWTEGKTARTAWVVCGVIILGLGMRTAVRDMDWTTEEALMRSSLVARPGSARLHGKLGKLALDQQDWKEARKELETAVSIYPGNAKTLLNLGMIEAREGNIDEAERRYWEANRAVPGGIGEAFNALCAIRLDRGKVDDETRRLCEEAVRRRPLQALVWSNYGRYQAGAGAPDRAEQAFRRALELAPQDLNVLNQFGEFLQGQNDLDQMVDVLFRVYALAPRRPYLESSLQSLVHTQAQMAIVQQRWDDAERMLTKAYEGLPRQAHWALGLAQVAKRRGDEETARRWFAKAKELGATIPADALRPQIPSDESGKKQPPFTP